MSARFGAEVLVPSTPLRLRAGYAYQPEPYNLLLGNISKLDPNRQTWTFGGGVLLADAFALDLGVALGGFTRIDRDFSSVSEERDQRRIHRVELPLLIRSLLRQVRTDRARTGLADE